MPAILQHPRPRVLPGAAVLAGRWLSAVLEGRGVKCWNRDPRCWRRPRTQRSRSPAAPLRELDAHVDLSIVPPEGPAAQRPGVRGVDGCHRAMSDPPWRLPSAPKPAFLPCPGHSCCTPPAPTPASSSFFPTSFRAFSPPLHPGGSWGPGTGDRRPPPSLHEL